MQDSRVLLDSLTRSRETRTIPHTSAGVLERGLILVKTRRKKYHETVAVGKQGLCVGKEEGEEEAEAAVHRAVTYRFATDCTATHSFAFRKSTKDRGRFRLPSADIHVTRAMLYRSLPLGITTRHREMLSRTGMNVDLHRTLSRSRTLG